MAAFTVPSVSATFTGENRVGCHHFIKMIEQIDMCKYYCYICDHELTDTNKSDEHIILNAIGGHLHSDTLLCKNCNNKIGEMSDAQLAEDLSFFTDMLVVKKKRQNPHNQIMQDEHGHEVIVENGGQKIILRRPLITKLNDNTLKITARNEKELKGIVEGLAKRGESVSESIVDIIGKAKFIKERPCLSKNVCITEKAFPSIIKSAVNYYMLLFHDAPTIKHLVPYILGEKNLKDVLYLHLFKNLPYETIEEQVTHMIHLEGNQNTKLLYAMMEFYGTYTYIVVLNSEYNGININKIYTYDTISSQEVTRSFSLPLRIEDLEQFRNQPHGEYIKYLEYVQNRFNNVMSIWQKNV